MSIAERLKLAREIVGISQNELEKRGGLSVGYVSRLEKGERGTRGGITEGTLQKLAVALGIRAAWLLSGDGEMVGDENPLPRKSAAIQIAREGGVPEAILRLVAEADIADAESKSVLWWVEEILLTQLIQARNHGDARRTSTTLRPAPTSGTRPKKVF